MVPIADTVTRDEVGNDVIDSLFDSVSSDLMTSIVPAAGSCETRTSWCLHARTRPPIASKKKNPTTSGVHYAYTHTRTHAQTCTPTHWKVPAPPCDPAAAGAVLRCL